MGKKYDDPFRQAIAKEIVTYSFSRQLTRKGMEPDGAVVSVSPLSGVGLNVYITLEYKSPEGLRRVGDFVLKELPGCCAYLISTQTEVYSKYRNNGFNTALQETKRSIASLYGYTYLICTTTKQNKIQNHILSKCGWEKTDEIKNSRTGNTIFSWKREVNTIKDTPTLVAENKTRQFCYKCGYRMKKIPILHSVENYCRTCCG